MKDRAIVIGSGFAGLSSAAALAKRGYEVLVIEKNAVPGGRARVLKENGYVFDMGPSWYWMPDIFEEWFSRFGENVNDHLDLVRLDPSYQVIHGPDDRWDIPADKAALRALFERIEPGAGARLDRFLNEARVKYELGMNDLVRGPALSWAEYAKPRVLSGMLSTTALSSLQRHVRASFSDHRLRMLLEFPVLFLGATADRIPALYSLMNYADMVLGTWYPMGGMGRIVEGMMKVAERQGVQFSFNEAVERVMVEDGRVRGVRTHGGELRADVVVATADYHHVDQCLLAPEHRSYSPSYWESRTMAPSSLLFYMGFDRRLPQLRHHNLFFDRSLVKHGQEIYDSPQWPSDPLFYTCVPSITDPSVAPHGHENVFGLIPIAPGLPDTEEVRRKYRNLFLDRLSAHTGVALHDHLVHERSYCINDFMADYNAFRGNAYGLANTLKQTAVLKPSMKSKKVRGLYFAGQLTSPGPGVPPALISGLNVAELIVKETPNRAKA